MSSERSARDSLLDFLDELDDEGDAETIDAAEGESGDIDNSMFREVKEKMIYLQLRLSQGEKELDLTREALAEQEMRTTESLEKARLDQENRLTKQKDGYEAVLQRQLAFSKAILVEKEQLTKKVEELLSTIRQRDKELATKVIRAKEDEQQRLAAAKAEMKTMMKAGERARRARLMDEMRATIKQDTIRALEPDIQRIIDKHNDEKRRLLGERDDALKLQGQLHQAEIDKLREKMERDRDRQLALERQLSQDRQQRLMQDQEWSFDQLRRRAEQERDDDRRRMTLERTEEKQAFEEALLAMRYELDGFRRRESITAETEQSFLERGTIMPRNGSLQEPFSDEPPK